MVDRARLDEAWHGDACIPGTPVHEYWLIGHHRRCGGVPRTPEQEQHYIDAENAAHGRRHHDPEGEPWSRPE